MLFFFDLMIYAAILGVGTVLGAIAMGACAANARADAEEAAYLRGFRTGRLLEIYLAEHERERV